MYSEETQSGNQFPQIKGHAIQWLKEKRTKGQTTIYKTLHRKLKIDQHEYHKKQGMNLEVA